MQIQKVIDKLKAYHKGEWEGKQIDEETTRFICFPSNIRFCNV